MFDAGAIRARMTVDKSQFDKAGKEVNKSQKKMTVQANQSGKAFKKMWKQVAAGIGITAGLAIAVRGVVRQFRDAIQTGREFEREWANVTTMLTVSRAETENLRQALRRLSPTLGDTADLARGMYQVLSASIEPAKAIDFLAASARAAKAGVTDTATAVDAITTVINAYAMEAEKAAEVSDIMFGIVKRGKLTYGELAHSLGTVIPVAATLGVNFRDVGAAIATLTRQGIDASKATMQLRQVLMLILDPSTEAKEVAKELELGMGQMALETKGLAGWLAELQEKTKGNTEQMVKIVPNARALTAVLALAGKASKGYGEDQAFLLETLGFTDEAMKKQMETMDYWIKTGDVAADKIKIAFYEGLISSFRESIINAEDAEQKVTDATNNMADKVSMHTSAMVEGFTLFKKSIDIQLTPLKKLGELLANITRKGDTYAELVEKQRIANERLAKSGADVKDVYAGMVEPAEEAGGAIDDTTDDVNDQIIAIDKLATGWELWAIQLRAVRAKIEPVKKSVIDTTDVLKQAAEAATSMNLRYKEVGFVQDEKAKKTKELTDKEITAYGALMSAYEGGISSIISVFERWAAAAVVKWVMTKVPWPWSIAAGALAMLGVKGLFSTIKGMEEGGWVGLHGEEIVKVGEGGPEYINSNESMRNIPGSDTIAPTPMPMKVIIQNRITIGEQTFYRESVKSINRAGEAGDIIVPIRVVV